jgi:putative toxin-antitoxin system antitoxin component (TIGR02293 family)
MIMSGRLRTYDGAANGVEVLRGLVVAKTGAAQSLAETNAAQPTELPPTSEPLSKRSVVDRVLERVTDVIGTREEALRWLGTPVRALNYATPISLLSNDAGADRVLAVLTNLESGTL